MLLALVSGCGGKESGNPVSGSTPATTEISRATQVQSAQVETVPDPATGEKVYKSTCSICHKSGLKGAPRMGIKEDWEMRLTQSSEVLYDHAINGFRGKKGIMPSRGSNAKLSNAEVKAAVDYMVEHAIPSWSLDN